MSHISSRSPGERAAVHFAIKSCNAPAPGDTSSLDRRGCRARCRGARHVINSPTDTRIDEIADGIFRISTRLPDLMPGGFTFNQFLIRDDEPALFHAGPKGLFPA